MTKSPTHDHPAQPAPTEGAGDVATSDLLQRIQATLDQARRSAEGAALRARPPARAPAESARLQALERRLAEAEAGRTQLASQLLEVQTQASHLMSLYVAMHQLHTTLDAQAVQEILADVATNLVGARAFALLREGTSDDALPSVVLARGLDADERRRFAETDEWREDPVVLAALRDDRAAFATGPAAPVLGAVPLLLQGRRIGLLVLLRLLPHKEGLEAHDRELLELVAVHAAAALLLAELHDRAQADAAPAAASGEAATLPDA